MKKFVIIGLIFGIVLPVFAQSQEVERKNFIESFSKVFDTFIEKQDLDSAEELNRISEQISSGRLGFGKEAVFEKYDAWMNLVVDYEKFWTENSPYEFEISALYQSGINYQNRTFIYSADVSCQYTEKYKLMAGIVGAGFRNAYDKDWQIDRNWPTVSAVNKIADKDLYNGIALVTYKNVKYPASLIDFKKTQKFYDISFDIVDLSGKTIFKSGRKLVGSEGSVEFKDIPMELKYQIDSKLVRIVPTGLFLEYGNCETISTTNRAWVKNLPEISFDLNKVVIRTGYDNEAITIDIAKEIIKNIDDTENQEIIEPQIIIPVEEDEEFVPILIFEENAPEQIPDEEKIPENQTEEQIEEITPEELIPTGEKKNNTSINEGKEFNVYLWTENSFLKNLETQYIDLIDPEITINIFELSLHDVTDYVTKKVDSFLENSFADQEGKSSDEKIDIFICDNDLIAKYVSDKYSLDLLNDLGISSQLLDSNYPYLKNLATNQDGKIKAVGVSTSPSVFMYKKSVAREVFGIDDPSEIQELIKDWESFKKSAEILKDHGYTITPSCENSYFIYDNQKEHPFVVDGKIVIPQSIEEWIKTSKNYIDEGYVHNYQMYDMSVFDALKENGDSFGVFCSDWYTVVLDAAEVSLENFGICKGPGSGDWGSTFVLAAKDTDNKETIKKIFEYILENGTSITQDKDEKINNYYKLSASEIRGLNNSKYDWYFRLMLNEYMKQYFSGEITEEEAWENWYEDVLNEYPELSR